MIRWNSRDPHKATADFNLSVSLLLDHARNGHALSARLEAHQVERVTGVPASQAVQMAREVIMVQNGVT